MKIYPNQRTAILQILQDITKQNLVLDKTLPIYFKQNPKWGSKDRKTVAQCSYDICRNYELLKYIATEKKTDVVTIYQDYLDESFQLDIAKILTEYPNIDFATKNAIPENVYKLYLQETPMAEENLIAMQRKAAIYLRVNVSQIDFDVFCDMLKGANIGYDEIREVTINDCTFSLNAIRLKEKLLPNSDFYIQNNSYFEFQDIGSQIISLYFDMSNEKNMLESCAGQGGKSIHLLDKMDSSQKLIAMDIDEMKLLHLKQRIARLFNKKATILPFHLESILPYSGKMDVLFLDVPCTGSGTMKRQSDIKYRINQDVIYKKTLLQREIFEQANPCLKPNGYLVYSTCSIFKSENESQTEWIVTQGYSLIKQMTLYPKDYEGDGFFVAVLQKKSLDTNG